MALSRASGHGFLKFWPKNTEIDISIELKAFPVDGRLVVLPPDSDDRSNK